MPSVLKYYSYFGAIRSRPSTSESTIAHVDEDTHEAYFDPTNMIYARMFRYVWGDRVLSEFNAESLGDILEAFLSFCWQQKKLKMGICIQISCRRGKT